MTTGSLKTKEGTLEAIRFVLANRDSDGKVSVGYNNKLDPWEYQIDSGRIAFGIAAAFHLLVMLEK